MAMTKKEQEEMRLLREARDMARALRWPDYSMPSAMTREEIEAAKAPGGMRFSQLQMVARGWFANAFSGQVTYGCSDGVHHSASGDTTTTQQMGRMYRTKKEALRVVRIERTIQYAAALAALDDCLGQEPD
jgi:hypothetical protein